MIPPLPLLEEAAAGWGIASIVRDSDGVVRRLYAGRDPEPSLAWAAARLLGAPVTTHRHVDFNGAWLNYYGPPLETFPSCNVEDVLRADGIPLERFRGKIVVVGGLPAAGVPGAGRDEFSTPYFRGRASGMAPGAEIHAVTLTRLEGGLKPSEETWKKIETALRGSLSEAAKAIAKAQKRLAA